MNSSNSLVRERRALLFDVPAFHDESLTSWLLRTSIAHGMNPLMLTDYYWGYRNRVWTLYLDLGFPFPSMQEDITWLSKGKPPTTFGTLLLQLPQRPKTKLGYLINPQTKRNRRSEHGANYCPICFESKTPYLKLEWQLATALYCHEHGCRLQQHCPHCNTLYSPQLLEAHQQINQCHHCSGTLKAFEINRIAVSDDACWTIHKNLVDALFDKKEVSALGLALGAHDYIDLLILFIGLVRYGARTQNQNIFRFMRLLKVPINYMEIPTVKRLSFPLLPYEERWMILNVVYRILQTDLKTLIDLMTSCKFTVETILNERHKGQTAPAVLDPLLAALPSAGRKKRKTTTVNDSPSSHDRVIDRWLLLQRRAQQKATL